MRTIENIFEIKANMEVMDKYLKSKGHPEYNFAIDLLKSSNSFLVLKEKDIFKFYPSKFTGYESNSMNNHLGLTDKVGKNSNSAISEIIGYSPAENPALDEEYKRYCERIGFVPNDKDCLGEKRKYWQLDFSGDSLDRDFEFEDNVMEHNEVVE